MAIIAEIVTKGRRVLVKHQSDSNKYIRQVETGTEYVSAVDVIPCRYTYEETERDIPEPPKKEE